MVFKLKELEGNSPGIIIFSHKEFVKYSKYKTFNKILKAYQKNYFFGVHWGFSFEDTSKYNFDNINMNFCYPEQLPDLDLKSQKIFPFTTRSFIPSAIFNVDEDVQKKYDVITITRKANIKFNRDLFNISKELILNNPKIKILILVSHPNYVKSNFDHLFDENYEKILGPHNSKQVELISFNEAPPQELVASYLQNSKIFLFTSRKEGVAKVTAEAALCNLPVLINKNFFGGARAGINPKYLFLYDSIQSASTQINNYLNSYDFNTKELKENIFTEDLIDTKNLIKLNKALEKFFNSKDKPYKGELDNIDLKNRMNSFLKELPKLYVAENNDLKSLTAVTKYFENFCIGNFKTSRVLILYDRLLNIRISFGIKDVLFILSPISLIKIIRRRNAYKKELPYE